jgi:hypothetical protein
MTDPIHSQSPAISGALPTGPKAGAPAGGTRSAHLFQALLEDLERRADEVKSSGANVRSTSDLSQAVESARASLEDALSVKDRLLEAFRQAALAPGQAQASSQSAP